MSRPIDVHDAALDAMRSRIEGGCEFHRASALAARFDAVVPVTPERLAELYPMWAALAVSAVVSES